MNQCFVFFSMKSVVVYISYFRGGASGLRQGGHQRGIESDWVGN